MTVDMTVEKGEHTVKERHTDPQKNPTNPLLTPPPLTTGSVVSSNPSSTSAVPRTAGMETYSSTQSFAESYMLAPPPHRSSYGDAPNPGLSNSTQWFDSFSPTRTPITPVYPLADAVIVTLPQVGSSPDGRGGPDRRLAGIRWMASNGLTLDQKVEKIVVLDATDLPDLPLGSEGGFDYKRLWESGIRVLLRKGENQRAVSEARAAAGAARAAADAAESAAEAAATGDVEKASKAAAAAMKIAEAGALAAKTAMEGIMERRRRLEEMGCRVESVGGGRPRDVMEHLGREGKSLVVWRAGCWGEKGVQSIEDGAFQSMSAHIAVDGGGGSSGRPSWRSSASRGPAEHGVRSR